MSVLNVISPAELKLNRLNHSLQTLADTPNKALVCDLIMFIWLVFPHAKCPDACKSTLVLASNNNADEYSKSTRVLNLKYAEIKSARRSVGRFSLEAVYNVGLF